MKKLLFAFVLTGTLLGCAGNKNTENVENQEASTERESLPIEAYLAVKDALVETDANKASQAASSFLELTENSQLISPLQTIANNTSDVKAQRAAFETLSAKMYELAKASQGEMVLYKQYCPMAFNNQGAFWLAAEQEVNNPYFGDVMLHCGSVQKTLN